MNNQQKENDLTRRLSPLYLIFIAFLILIFGRILYLQITRGEDFKRLSEVNRIRHEKIPARRGIIRDYTGKIVAADEPIPHLVKNSRRVNLPLHRLIKLANGLELARDKLEDKLLNSHRRIIIRGLNEEQQIWFEEHAHYFSDLKVRNYPHRVYRYDEAMAPVVGYTGEIDKKELQSRRGQGLSQGDIVGKGGIEYYYDSQLRGNEGLRWIEVSATGEFIRELSSPRSIPPSSGRDLQLAVDVRLQKKIHKSFTGDSGGAAVVMEIPSGRVRAFYSHPSYDPNNLIFGDDETIHSLLRAKNDPLHNRITRGRFPPGSTFKIIPYAAVLAAKKFNPGHIFNCDGKLKYGDHTFRCWEEDGHGRLNLHRALVHSCNVYFYKLVQKLGYKPVLKFARKLNYNRKTGIDFPRELKPQLSSPRLKKNYTTEDWTGGDEVNAIIGQGYTLVTPIKQAQLFASLLTGKLIVPRLNNNRPSKHKKTSLDTGIYRKKMVETLGRVVEEGTGYWAQHDTSYQKIAPEIIGKTGTVQKIKVDDESDSSSPDAWFVSAAPRDNPRYVVVVYLDGKGTGGEVAAPRARQIYRKMHHLGYFNRNQNGEKKENEQTTGGDEA
ncbi:MAG: penicillin-binding protein 2 [bacterium]